jgi:pantoate--beta-alanine ligase
MTAPTPPVSLTHSIADLRARVRAFRGEGARVGLVPTMGALHAGHLSLVEALRPLAQRVIVTIFVNPAQFGPTEDFSRYPRSLPSDLEKLASVGADLVFAPAVEEMYPGAFCTTVACEGPAKTGLEDAFRPTHFAGVATVVAKLLNQAQADVAIFGEKDFQQLLVIRAMARDLDIPTQILSCATLREADGLAMSSRNVYLSPQERALAPELHRELSRAAMRVAQGETLDAVMRDARAAMTQAGFAIDYLEARCAQTLAPIARHEDGPLRLLVAARLGMTRLIDNVAV